jgi:hypothetical protein
MCVPAAYAEERGVVVGGLFSRDARRTIFFPYAKPLARHCLSGAPFRRNLRLSVCCRFGEICVHPFGYLQQRWGGPGRCLSELVLCVI